MLLAGQSKDFSGLTWQAFLPCLPSNAPSFGILLQNIHSESLSFAEEKKKKKKEDEAAAISTVMVRLTRSLIEHGLYLNLGIIPQGLCYLVASYRSLMTNCHLGLLSKNQI